MTKLSDWTKGPTAGKIPDKWGSLANGSRETKPTYRYDAAPYGVYYVMPARDSKGLWIGWEVKVNTYQPDAKGRNWRRIGMALTVNEGILDAVRDAEGRI